MVFLFLFWPYFPVQNATPAYGFDPLLQSLFSSHLHVLRQESFSPLLSDAEIECYGSLLSVVVEKHETRIEDSGWDR